jgi:membrane-associated phospholipid phosphatase
MTDDAWYLDVVGFAQHTSWLHAIAIAFTTYGVILEGLAILWLAWRSRRSGDEVLAKVLWIPIAMVVAYLLDSGIKQLVAEPRPCRALQNVATLLPCDAPTDYAFPSNHAVLVASFAAAIVLLSRRWSVLAWIFAIVMAASRVYVGAHYPHDVVAGLLIGAIVGYCGYLVQRPLTSLVATIRTRTTAVAHSRK